MKLDKQLSTAFAYIMNLSHQIQQAKQQIKLLQAKVKYLEAQLQAKQPIHDQTQNQSEA